MSKGSWSDSAYTDLSAKRKTAPVDDIFTKDVKVTTDMDPKNIKIREARDSDKYPNSLAVGVFLDDTGSMGNIPKRLATEKLGSLMNTILKHKVDDPQILFGSVNDAFAGAKYPLMVGQYEVDNAGIDKWLTGLLLQGGGGSDDHESYMLAWIFASRFTSIDCYEKRNKKGVLFTIGDEATHPAIPQHRLEEIFGGEWRDITAEQAFNEASKMYEIYHIHCEDGSYNSKSKHGQAVVNSWRKLIGEERVILLDDSDNVAEIIASIVALISGAHLKDIVKDFDNKTADVVSNALVRFSGAVAKPTTGVLTL